MRINRYVAAATGLSRRAADTAIAAGRVTIGGAPRPWATRWPESTGWSWTASAAPPRHPHLRHAQQAHRLCFQPPPPGRRPHPVRVAARQRRALRPAGRLDRDSSGLMLLSDDGDFIHRYTHPSYDKLKIYELTLSRAAHPPPTASSSKTA